MDTLITDFSLWYKVKTGKSKGATLYIRGSKKNGYSECKLPLDGSEMFPQGWKEN